VITTSKANLSHITQMQDYFAEHRVTQNDST